MEHKWFVVTTALKKNLFTFLTSQYIKFIEDEIVLLKINCKRIFLGFPLDKSIVIFLLFPLLR